MLLMTWKMVKKKIVEKYDDILNQFSYSVIMIKFH